MGRVAAGWLRRHLQNTGDKRFHVHTMEKGEGASFGAKIGDGI